MRSSCGCLTVLSRLIPSGTGSPLSLGASRLSCRRSEFPWQRSLVCGAAVGAMALRASLYFSVGVWTGLIMATSRSINNHSPCCKHCDVCNENAATNLLVFGNHFSAESSSFFREIATCCGFTPHSRFQSRFRISLVVALTPSASISK